MVGDGNFKLCRQSHLDKDSLTFQNLKTMVDRFFTYMEFFNASHKSDFYVSYLIVGLERLETNSNN